jgi:cell division protease FtsH
VAAGERTASVHDWMVAIHEAGHAVAAIVIGWDVVKVTIEGVGEIGGYCEYDYSRRPAPQRPVALRAWVSDCAITTLAGCIAQRLFGQAMAHGGRGDRAAWESMVAENAENDLRQARRLAQANLFWGDRGEIDVFVREVATASEALVRREIEAVFAVARALVDRRSLTGEELRKIVRP